MLTDRAQLDDRWSILAMGVVVTNLVAVLLFDRFAIELPEWVPVWLVFLPSAVVVFWWVPVLAFFALKSAYVRLGGENDA